VPFRLQHPQVAVQLPLRELHAVLVPLAALQLDQPVLSGWSYGPLVFLDSMEKFTLPVGVALFQSSYANEYGLTLAASVICTTPIILIFLIFSRQIVRGIMEGAVKS